MSFSLLFCYYEYNITNLRFSKSFNGGNSIESRFPDLVYSKHIQWKIRRILWKRFGKYGFNDIWTTNFCLVIFFVNVVFKGFNLEIFILLSSKILRWKSI